MISKLEVVDGEAASIRCLAIGKPPPTYQWIRSATSLNLGASNERFSVDERTGIIDKYLLLEYALHDVEN